MVAFKVPNVSASSQTTKTSWFDTLAPRWKSGHDIELLHGGKDYFSALEKAINSATTQVLLETYIFQDDASGRRIAAALASAAERGVQVNLVIDGFGTGKLEGEVDRLISTSLVNLEIFRPNKKRFSLNRQRLRRLHRKLCVIDSERAFVGGINMLDDYFDPNHGVLDAPRFDFAVHVRGPLVANVQLAMQRLWWELRILSGRERLGMPSVLQTVTASDANLRAMFVPRDNFRFRRTIELHYLKAIGHAKHEVFIANAYFFPGVRFRRALVSAARRGVKVRLLLQGKVEYRLQYYATQAMYAQLLRAGVEIVEYKKSFLHAKVAVIDQWTTVGSSNIDPFSLLLAREANVVVDSDAFACELRNALELGAKEGGEPVLLKNYVRRSMPVRFLHWCSFILLRAAVALTGVSGKY
jgi:cardiolipin synthase A/B